MTFLNPLLLLGLAAAAIPVLIHLFNLRKLKTVEFSSLRFLKELQKTKMRRIKLRQLLLLALRTLLIASLVLAFARPVLRGSFAGLVGPHARTTMVFLVDDSPSTGVRNDGGVLLNQLRESAVAVTSLLGEGDELHVLPVSRIGREDPAAPHLTAAAAAEAVRAIPAAAVSVPYQTAFGVAARVLAGARNANQEIYLFTDGQSTQFTRAAAPEDSADLFDDRQRVFLVEARPGRTDNRAVTRVRVVSSILGQGVPAEVEATVQNFGEEPVRGLLVSLYLGGSRIVQQTVDLPPRSPVTLRFTAVPRSAGILQGVVQIEDDQLEADDRRWFVLPIPQTIRVLLASGSREDERFPALALGVASDSAGKGLFSVRRIDEADFGATDLSKFDLLVLAGLADFTPSEGERLGAFLRSGGGVVLFPGAGTRFDNYATTLFGPLGIPPARGAQGEAATAEGSFLAFATVDTDHPLFSGLFEDLPGRKPGLRRAVESPRIYRTSRPALRSGDQPIITLSDGTPFLAEYRVGEGRLLLFSVEAGLTWSDFPLKGAFLPLLHRSASYLAQRERDRREFLVGEPVECSVRLHEGVERSSFVLRSPSGNEERMSVRTPSGGAVLLAAAGAAEPGIHTVHARGSGPPLHAVVVNPLPDESDLRSADDAERSAFFSRTGLAGDRVRSIPAGAALAGSVKESRFGVELWKHFLALALALAVAEMILGRERRGGTPEDQA